MKNHPHPNPLPAKQGEEDHGRKKLKIALVHDYIKEYGGAERVLETLHEMYPDAPIYTLVYCPEFLGPHRQRFKNWDIRESWVGEIPFKHKFISLFRLIAPFVFQQFDLSGYDVVIVSATGAYCPNMIRTKQRVSSLEKKTISYTLNPRPLHICYCHTPPRYLYGYATARNLSNNIFLRGFAKLANHFLRLIDYASSQRPDIFIANSENVKARIKKFYGRDAAVVYPPVSVASSNQRLASSLENKTKPYTLNPRPYFVAGGRLARPKHIDLIIKACQELGMPLKIFGKSFAGYGEELEKLIKTSHPGGSETTDRISRDSIASLQNDKGSLIEFFGEIDDREKMQLLRNAKAYIFAGEDEDFGILPVEAMSVGTPIIAYRSGGVVETVVDPSASSGQATGLFFDNLTVKSLINAMKRFEKITFAKAAVVKQAQKFSKKNFENGIKEVIRENLPSKSV